MIQVGLEAWSRNQATHPESSILRISVKVAMDTSLKLEHVLDALLPHEGGRPLAAYPCRTVHEDLQKRCKVAVVSHMLWIGTKCQEYSGMRDH